MSDSFVCFLFFFKSAKQSQFINVYGINFDFLPVSVRQNMMSQTKIQLYNQKCFCLIIVTVF